MWYVCDVLYAVFYVSVNCFLVRGCTVLRRYTNVCNSDMLSVADMYLDHVNVCVVCINGRRYVCCREYYVVSNECDEPTPSCAIYRYAWWVVKVCTLGVFALGVSLVS